MRELQVGSSYVSQNPLFAHFGLAESDLVELLEVHWPDGEVTILTAVEANQRLIIKHPYL